MSYLGAFLKGKGKSGKSPADQGVDLDVWTHFRTQPTTYESGGTVMTSETPQPASAPASGWVHGLMPRDREALTGGNNLAIVRELAFRGDDRTPDAIMAAGGLLPRGGTQWRTILPDTKAMDPGQHVGWEGDTAKYTIFVSCSRSYRIAKGFSRGGYVYVLRVNQGVDISNFGAGGASLQCEVSALFGVKFEDILGVKVLNSGNVYRNIRFVTGGLSLGQMTAALNWLADGLAVQPI